MKTLKIILTVTLILALTLNVSYSGQSKYKLIVTNTSITSANSLEFDIILSNSSDSKDILKYSAAQYFLEFNPKIANGGTLTYSIVSSDLPETFRPVNASVSGNLLRLASNMPQAENAPEIPVTGLLIVKMKLETSAQKFSSDPLDLKWAGDESQLRTKICTTTGNLISEITDSYGHYSDNSTGTIQTLQAKETPQVYSIAQNYPNPFNPVTKISFEIPVTNFVTLKVYDITGRAIASLVNENLNAGSYNVQFNGANFASGVYFYKIEAGSFSEIRKMFLIK